MRALESKDALSDQNNLVTGPTSQPRGEAAPLSMFGEAIGTLGRGVLQRKLARRMAEGPARADEGATQGQATQADGPAPASRPTVRFGSQGPDVSHAQQRLNLHGASPPLAEDGIFGPLTRQATAAFQTSHALAPDSVIGSHTWASLEGPAQVGGTSGQGVPGTNPGSAGNQLNYDTGGHIVQPPPKGTKLAQVRQMLADKQKPQQGQTKPDLGPTLKQTGVKPGTDEEIFLWFALVQLGTSNRWGTEADVQMDVGWPPASGPAPRGQATVRLDGQGNAEVALLNQGAVAKPVPFGDRGTAEQVMKKVLGIAQVRDGSAAWTLEELAKMHSALHRLSGPERSALSGVALVREARLFSDKGEPLAGQFSWNVKLGGPNDTQASKSAELRIATLAFANDDISFIGDKGDAAVASFETIVHEAGHAVETSALREAKFATAEATGDFNQKNVDMNAAVSSFNKESAATFGKLATHGAPERTAARPFLRALNAATTAIDALGRGQNASQHAQHQLAAAQAIAKRNQERDGLAQKAPKNPVLADFAESIKRQDTWFTAAEARAAAHGKMEDAKTQEAQVSGKQGGQAISARLKHFVDFVNRNKIEPLTDYARKNWPANPEEFYAEAFSLWKNDPTYLGREAKPLLDWFNQGNHLL